MLDYKLQPLYSFSGTLHSPPEVIGQLSEGARVNFYPSSGTLHGPRVRGALRTVGGDWMVLRRDGIAQLDVRTTIETHDGALILLTYQGTADFGADGYERFLARDLPKSVRIHITPRFATSHPEYVWLNRVYAIGIGEYSPAESSARYDVYAVQ